MPSTLLTPDIILLESLQILKQNQVFLGLVNRTYDKEFGRNGSKIGDEIRVRRPNTFKIRRGARAEPQRTTERYDTIKIDRQVGVDMKFTSKELALDMDQFRPRILEPAIVALLADVESQMLEMTRDVPMIYPADITATSNIYEHELIYDWVDRCGREFDIELVPKQDRHALLNNVDQSLLIDNLKNLYGDSEQISAQFTEGKMDRWQGFSHKSIVHMPFYRPGRSVFKNDLKTARGKPINFSDITEGQQNLPIDATANDDWRKGDIVTVTNMKKVHPETKRVYRECNMTFVVTQDAVRGESLQVWPPIYKDEGKYQNVKTFTEKGLVALYAASNNSLPQRQNLYFHKEAFTMATVDLEMPHDVDFKSRENHDGISMRIIRKYDINNDEFPCRLDVLFGFKTIRPAFARRIMGGQLHQ